MTEDELWRMERIVLKIIAYADSFGWDRLTTRGLREGIKARAANVDEALRSLESKHQVKRVDGGWEATRSGRTRLGHGYMARRGDGGAQVALGRAVDRVSAGLVAEFDMDPSLADRLARGWLVEALSERQRARLLNNAT